MKTVYHGTKSVSFLGWKILDMLPDDCKNIDNLKFTNLKLFNHLFGSPGFCAFIETNQLISS